MNAIEIIAHRGYSARAPENTVAALRAARNAGATSVEWDVMPAADGVPMLFHDDDLERTSNGLGPFVERTAAELASLDAGSWFAPAFAGEPIPTLEHTLRVAGRGFTQLYPEIKSFRNPGDVQRVWEVVRDAGLLARTVFISIQWESLDLVRSLDPDAAIGYVVARPQRYEEALERALGDSLALVDPDWAIILDQPTSTERAVADGISLVTWTVDDTDTARRLLEVGVSRFTTNEVQLLMEWAGSAL